MSHAAIIHRIAACRPKPAQSRTCAGPLCLGASLPRSAFATDRHRHCKACVDRLHVIELERMLTEARETAARSVAQRQKLTQRIHDRLRDLDDIARRAAGERED